MLLDAYNATTEELLQRLKELEASEKALDPLASLELFAQIDRTEATKIRGRLDQREGREDA